MEVAFNTIPGFDHSFLDVIHELIEETTTEKSASAGHHPFDTYLREARAMAATPADVKELPEAYVFVLDMPWLSADQVRVDVEEDGRTLVVSGERKREKERDQGIRYVWMERRLGKYLKRFPMPENANVEKVAARYKDGVLTVTVVKKPPEEPKKPKTVEVQVA
ncbi:unnamed protein product [Linum tenue]|uniref:SHSP domain-containing protein n=4 Tax=Linum tenue TaxID=586396 RepID=A0AAV0N605_9ROSI|nr:unnamed protein product [Linum tenue]